MGSPGQVRLSVADCFSRNNIFFARCVTDDLISESFMQDQRFLKYRSLILRAVTASLLLSEDIHPNHAKGSENGSSVNMVDVLESLTEKLKAHHEEVTKSEVNFKALKSPVQGPYRSRLTLFVEGQNYQIVYELLNSVVEAQKVSQGGSPTEGLKKAASIFKDVIKEITSQQSHSLKHREELFERTVNIIEVRCFYTFIY